MYKGCNISDLWLCSYKVMGDQHLASAKLTGLSMKFQLHGWSFRESSQSLICQTNPPMFV